MSAHIIKARDNLYIHSVFIDKIGLCFNQFIIEANNKLTIIETGFRSNFNTLCENLRSVNLNPETIECVIVPHFEADEMGALPEIQKISTQKLKVYAHPICAFALNDIFNAKAKPVKDNEIIKLADGVSIKFIHITHTHQWDCMVAYWVERKILFSSDLFIQQGEFKGIKSNNCVQELIDAVQKEGYLPSAHYFQSALDKISQNEIDMILPMHGSGLTQYIPDYIATLKQLSL